MLTVLTSATDERLTTVPDVKDALKLTDSVDENYLEKLIDRASQRVVSYCNQPLALRTYQAVLSSYGGPWLLLPRSPIHAVLRVFDGTATGTGTEVAASDYRVDKPSGRLWREDGWVWSRQLEAGAISGLPVPGGEWRPWLVEWSAGYIGPNGTSSTSHGNTSTGRTLPHDVEEACLELVKSAYNGRGRADDIQSERLGDVAVTYKGTGSRAMPETVKDLLAPYRSVM